MIVVQYYYWCHCIISWLHIKYLCAIWYLLRWTASHESISGCPCRQNSQGTCKKVQVKGHRYDQSRDHCKEVQRNRRGQTNSPWTEYSPHTPTQLVATSAVDGTWTSDLSIGERGPRSSITRQFCCGILGKLSYLNLSLCGWLVQLTCVCTYRFVPWMWADVRTIKLLNERSFDLRGI